MSGARPPLEVYRSSRFDRRLREVDADLQQHCRSVVLAISRRSPTPGHRIKPILPQKYFFEARLNRSDRLIFRIEGEKLHLVDIVAHDDIDRYGRR